MRHSVIIFSSLVLLLPLPANALLSLEEALKFGLECAVERKSVYLSDAQVKEAARLSGEETPSALVTRFEPLCPERKGSAAYLDSHRVRTKPETLLIFIGPDQRVTRIETISFQEPPDYLPRAKWYAQFEKKTLSDDLRMKRGIAPVTGATLTANATVAASRRALAVHQLVPPGQKHK